MPYDPKIHHRRSLRLKGYDYARSGAYFVTLCIQNHVCFFGEIADQEVHLTDGGKMVQSMWKGLPGRFNHLELDQFVVMPNHLHGILWLNGRGEPGVCPQNVRREIPQKNQGENRVRPNGTTDGSVGRVLQAFKSLTTHGYIQGVKQSGWSRFNGKLWQRNYWERVVRDDAELGQIREYIANNPVQWEMDRLNPDRTG